ncbi:MAG: hypothetical protein HZA49_09650 [Planctomycetes bacterium]|nr:hypothetical protein [Planctomycetota bacterium]
MKTYRCPTCKKPLTKNEFERALGILDKREKYYKNKEASSQKKVQDLKNMWKKDKQAQSKKIKDAGKSGERKGIRKAGRMVTGLKTENEKLHKRISQLEKGKTPQTEGLEFEEKLAARLRREFREDDIQHKGKGGDVLHIVKFNQEPVGVIIYECKRESKIKPQHIRQTYLAKQSREAEFAVLVTTGQKKGFSGLSQMDGVLVVSPLGTVPLASLLRGYLKEMNKAKIPKDKRTIIAQQLMKYITSPQFKNPIDEVVQLSSELQGMVIEEYKDHCRTWNKRLNNYKTIEWDSSQIRKNLQLVQHGKKPEVSIHPKATLLQLPAPL